MGNNTSRSTQWAEASVKRDGPVCGHVQPRCPHKICTRDPGHDGDHCEEKQAGTIVIRVWWKREALSKAEQQMYGCDG